MSGQDWLNKDFYAQLGVSKDASAADIKKAYRKLARTYHPDQNPGDAAAEAKFKEIGEAYAVLADAEQRKQYDALRAMAGGGPRFSAGRGGAGSSADFEDLFGGMFGGAGGADGSRVRYSSTGGAGFEDILSQMFGGQGAGGFATGPRPQRGADVTTEATLPFRQALNGSTVQLTVDGRTMTARIPPGMQDGKKIRLRGKGRPGTGGGEPGDLIITVHVEPHPLFSLDGSNVRVTVPITFDEAALGAQIEVPTVDGGSVRLKVPAGTSSGTTLRVKKRGLLTKGPEGDMLVTVTVVVPKKLSGDAKRAVEAFREAAGDADPRAALRDLAGE